LTRCWGAVSIEQNCLNSNRVGTINDTGCGAGVSDSIQQRNRQSGHFRSGRIIGVTIGFTSTNDGSTTTTTATGGQKTRKNQYEYRFREQPMSHFHLLQIPIQTQ
jgi:hypothetical protein